MYKHHLDNLLNQIPQPHPPKSLQVWGWAWEFSFLMSSQMVGWSCRPHLSGFALRGICLLFGWVRMASFPPLCSSADSYTFIIVPYKVPIQSNDQHLPGKIFVFSICGPLLGVGSLHIVGIQLKKCRRVSELLPSVPFLPTWSANQVDPSWPWAHWEESRHLFLKMMWR